MNLNIKDKFNVELPADPDRTNTRRQVFNSCFSYVTPRVPSKPKLIHASKEMADNLGISEEELEGQDFLQVFSGAKVLDHTNPYAMCYGGHQFGQWAGQLGDGRAINLAEIEHEGKNWALQLKGAGATPYSRRGDGLAVLRSSIREHLCSEAMFHLGVPTTRSLSLMLTGDQVMRDIMYDGNPAFEKGAVVCRVSPSFIRFGNFEIFTSRGDVDSLRTLANYTIRHFFPGISIGTPESYLAFFEEVAERTLIMVVAWQRVGFVHGVMNTDNMSILGLTIDYGPYGWLEDFDFNWTPNTTDSQRRRYRFGQQPQVALWNLLQLANALYPLVGEGEPLEEILHRFNTDYQKVYLDMMRDKLGLTQHSQQHDLLIEDLVEVLQLSETDMTIFFRKLAEIPKVAPEGNDDMPIVAPAFYKPHEITGNIAERWQDWMTRYRSLLGKETASDFERKAAMDQVNPKYVLRNYMAQLAIDAADNGDYSLVDELYQLLKRPYDDQPEMEKWFAKRPDWARYKVGCSMLSCSS